ncbi:Endonuclease/exonuclease/phosphatase [Scheffersomyces xylosifermentans]|uniref:Endonuclease/exonuclease/phosphatase n=1 Tax=Scheffersomyces xylosifermentans TaxID=1304137 RepID=UPI00315DF4C0
MSSTKEGIPLYLFTYNCNKRRINHDLFIPKIVESFPEELSSLYVFGLEELCPILDGSFYDVANQHLIKFNEVFLHALLEKYGKKDHRFQTIAIHHIGATGIIIITPYPSKFHSIKKASSSCGTGHSSLKGAAAVRLTYSPEGRNSTSARSVELSFANAHLSAYEGEFYFKRRNDNATTLMRSLDFGDGHGLLKPGSHTFFMGDLNYRTTKNYDSNSIATQRLLALSDQSNVNNGSVEELVQEYDELTSAIENGDIFTGFSEGCVDFQPTYKYHINTAIYNSKRSPSWCDRILYQATYESDERNGEAVLLRLRKDSNSQNKKKRLPLIHAYSSIKSLLQSDHQPVYLSITVPFNAPKSIVAPNGYLQILPSETANRHLHHNEIIDEGVLEQSVLHEIEESVTGPTQIYMKPTKYDYIIQNYVRTISDFGIGYGLWLTITPKGRLLLLGLLLAAWAVWKFVL